VPPTQAKQPGRRSDASKSLVGGRPLSSLNYAETGSPRRGAELGLHYLVELFVQALRAHQGPACSLLREREIAGPTYLGCRLSYEYARVKKEHAPDGERSNSAMNPTSSGAAGGRSSRSTAPTGRGSAHRDPSRASSRSSDPKSQSGPARTGRRTRGSRPGRRRAGPGPPAFGRARRAWGLLRSNAAAERLGTSSGRLPGMGIKVIAIQLERVVVWFESAYGSPVRPRGGGLSDSGVNDGSPLLFGLCC